MTNKSQLSSEEAKAVRKQEGIEDNEKREKIRGKFDKNLFEELSP